MRERARISADHIVDADAADLLALLSARGITLKGKGANLAGPCLHCGGDDRFGINTTKRAWHCRGCGAGGYGAISLARFLDGAGFRETVEQLAGAPHNSAKPRDNTAKRQHTAAWLWSLRKPIIGSPAERYLRCVRGYHGSIPATLAFLLPTPPKYPEPCMIAALGLCDEPEPGVIVPPRRILAVHLTKLRPDGSGKADVDPNKIVIGTPSGLPIVFAPPNDLLGLVVTEGIEDGLSAHEATGLGAWAAYSGSNLEKLAPIVPDYIETVTIFAHDDDNGVGQGAAYALAKGLTDRKIEVFLEGVAQ